MSRAARSLLFLVIYSTYVLLVMVPVQRLILWPLVSAFGSRRRSVIGAWLRLQARVVLALTRVGGLRFEARGEIPAESCVVLMNHQSLLDVPIGISLVTGPYPLIPARASYGRGIPGISFLMRLARCPFLDQGEGATRAELLALARAADDVARGEQSFLIYPEGHRSRDGRLQPFMPRGSRLVLERARDRPVYLVVVDGLWHLRTLADIAFRLAGSSARAVVLGPFAVPGENSEVGPFVEFLRERMAEALASLRLPATENAPLAARPHPAA